MRPEPADLSIEAIIRMRSAAQAEARSQQKPRAPVWLTGEKRKVAFTAQPSESSRTRRSDITIALLGITLGLICALFPWYIFFNPEKFGPPAIRFGGTAEGTPGGTVSLSSQAERVGAPSLAVPPSIALDLLATGTTGDPAEARSAREQPFPPSPAPFQVVHIANGRAMIQDDSGLFLVQRGSTLPDLSRVASIELREGRWVIVTQGGETLTAE